MTLTNNLGSVYAKGQGVPQDYATALSWYRKAAEQGYAELKVISGSCTTTVWASRGTMRLQ
jgi:TPR repeat protein